MSTKKEVADSNTMEPKSPVKSDKIDANDPSTDSESDAPALSAPPLSKISEKCEDIGHPYHPPTADVNFIFDVDGIEEVVPVHKFMLAFHSPVFRQMFYGELKEKGDIKLTDTTIDAFIDFMKCIYETDCDIGVLQSTLSPLLALAHKYDVNWLEKECQRILNTMIDEKTVPVLWVLPLANLYSFDEMRRKCIDKIHAHGNSIIKSIEFVDCDTAVLKEILGVSFVNRNEVNVFEICIKWAKRACKKDSLDPESPENVRKQLGDCFDLVRFDSMTMAEFMKCLSISSGVFTSHEIEQIAGKFNGTSQQNGHREPNLDVTIKTCEIFSPYNTIELSLQLLLEDQSTTDVSFVFKNDKNEETGRFSAHKCILASVSKVFEHQFADAVSSSEITITEVSAEVFKGFLRLAYVRFYQQVFAIIDATPNQNIGGIIFIAKKYKVSHMIDAYVDRFTATLNEHNVIWRFKLAHEHSLPSLKRECIDLMKEKGETIITSEAFMDFNQPSLKAILELRIWDNEKTLPDACVKWAKKYCKENQLDAAISYDLRMAIDDFFHLIPFAAMDPLEFIDFQRKYRGLLTADEVLKVINSFGDRRNAGADPSPN